MKEQIIKKTISDIKKELEAPDQKIIALYQTLEKLPKNINELFEKLRILTSTIYPTLEEELNIKEYCLFCLKDLNENNKKLEFAVTPTQEEKEIIIEFVENILKLIDIKEKIEKEAHLLAEKNYPNFCKIATTKIACQMLVISGSFKRLKNMPSSTVQLLGAEKALFKAFRSNSKKTPKYGLLYNHPKIISLNKKEKGKTARSLAGKIVIAIKCDVS